MCMCEFTMHCLELWCCYCYRCCCPDEVWGTVLHRKCWIKWKKLRIMLKVERALCTVQNHSLSCSLSHTHRTTGHISRITHTHTHNLVHPCEYHILSFCSAQRCLFPFLCLMLLPIAVKTCILHCMAPLDKRELMCARKCMCVLYPQYYSLHNMHTHEYMCAFACTKIYYTAYIST